MKKRLKTFYFSCELEHDSVTAVHVIEHTYENQSKVRLVLYSSSSF